MDLLSQDDAAVLKKAAEEANSAIAEAKAKAREETSIASVKDEPPGDEKERSEHKAGGDEERLLSLADSKRKSGKSKGSKVGATGGDTTSTTAPVTTSGKSQLVDSEDGSKWLLDLPVGGAKSDMKLVWLGDSLTLRYKKDDVQYEHQVGLPQAFSDTAVHARLETGGERLHIEFDKNDGSASAVADGEVCTFETVPNTAASEESIDVDVKQSRADVTVTLRASRSTEVVNVVFAGGALEVRATRIEQRTEANKGVSKVKKTVVETLKVPFKPSAITHTALPDGGSGRVIVLAKPAKAPVLANPKELTIH
jgi:hypothetical protein